MSNAVASARRRVRLCAVLVLVLSAGPLTAQYTPYATRTQFLQTPAGVGPMGLLGYVNPAVLGRLHAAETAIAWSPQRAGTDVVNDWGLYSALPHVGFGVVRRHGPGGIDFSEYRLGLGGGNGSASGGVGWGWSSGDGAPDPVWLVGGILQPSRWLSFGATWTATTNGDIHELAGHLGWRPLASPRLSLFAAAAHGWDTGDASYWSGGADVQLAEGFHVTSRYVDGGTLHLGARLEFGTVGVSTQSQVRSRRSGDDIQSVHVLRLGPNRGDVAAPLQRRQPSFLRLDLRGPVRHRAYPMFDEGQSLLQLLTTLHSVGQNPALAGVAINLSGLRLDPSMSWELRSQLQALRDAGRTVVVYIDRVDLRGYHLASVADVVVLDPAGLIVLQGVAAGQIYMKGALDKLGIGSQEWRYHEYKSAFESVNRTGMSAHDREQWQALLDDDYHRARVDITSGRGLAATAFDSLVNDVTGLLPSEALAAGLVDSIGRWEAVERIVTLRGGRGGLVEPQDLSPLQSEAWGAPPTVAIVYALGVCDMDSGIRARDLAAELRRLADDDGVRAVVLRVDSPGGDVLASDLVADAVAACKVAKPVIVSQARLAASGGYWISMESNAILATPATIAGSIGVIGGWLYNEGFRERLGITVDHVQVGDHADLGLGMPLPLLGTPLPDRALTDQEVQRTDHVMTALYDDFVGRVARARKRTPAEIDAVARGRVWSGTAAVEQGLVDSLGGLQAAIAMAASRAGISPGRPLRLTEWPRLGWFSLPGLPGLVQAGLSPRTDATAPAWLSWLQFRLEHNGQAMIMLPEPLLEQVDPAPRDRR